MGEVQGAIAKRAEEVFEPLTPLEKEAARRIFIQLVRPGEQTEDTRRRATFTEISNAARPVIKSLADARLVVTERDETTGEDTIEVAHEALIRNWKRLRSWLDEDREFLLWRQRLRGAFAEWKRTEQDEGSLLRGSTLTEAERWFAERPQDLTQDELDFIHESVALSEREWAARERQRRRITLGLSVGLVVVLILAGLVVVQWRLSEKHRKIAFSRQLDAQSITHKYTEAMLNIALRIEGIERLKLLASVLKDVERLIERDLSCGFYHYLLSQVYSHLSDYRSSFKEAVMAKELGLPTQEILRDNDYQIIFCYQSLNKRLAGEEWEEFQTRYMKLVEKWKWKDALTPDWKKESKDATDD